MPARRARRSAPKPTAPSRAWYALRRTLPLWSFEENLRELERLLPRYRVDEIIVKVDTEEFTHGQPPIDWVRAYQPKLLRIRESMDRLGVRFSINPWITVGHCDRGRDSRAGVPGLRCCVGHDGTECTCCACPLDEAWRAHVARVWSIYAETRPHIIWVEDDIRTFNHNPVHFGCFCPIHLRRFSERVGRAVTREELVAAILQPGAPHPWRAEYLDMQAEAMIDTVSFLGRTVHRTSPDTALGLMSSGPLVHCLEGRRWREFALAMADGQPVYSRPPMGNYNEDSLRGLYYSHDSIKITRHCMPPGTIEQTEVENWPFTPFSKSVAFSFVETALSFAYGSHGVTLNLYDHMGTPLEADPEVGRMLGERKGYLEGLAARAQQPGSYRGVRILYHERASYHKRLPPSAPYHALIADGAFSMYMLETHGVATTYDDAPVVAASGQTIRALGDAEVRTLLGGGVLLDGTAVHALCARGFGPLVGARSAAEPVCIDTLGAFGAEEYFNPDFGGADKTFLTLTLPHLGGRPSLAVLDLEPAARVISRVVDPDARRHHPCMYAFENALGGRVVAQALDLASAYGPGFNNPFRTRQLHRSLLWASRDALPLIVRGGVYPLAFRKDVEAGSLLGLFNLSLDPWPHAEFDLGQAPGRIAAVERLTPAGRWVKETAVRARRSGGRLTVRYARPVSYDEPLFLSIRWK